MSLQVNGTIEEILPRETGNSPKGNWIKRNVLVRTSGDHPKVILFHTFGKVVDVLDSLSPGMTVAISFNIESKPYNGKHFTTVTAWKIEKG